MKTPIDLNTALNPISGPLPLHGRKAVEFSQMHGTRLYRCGHMGSTPDGTERRWVGALLLTAEETANYNANPLAAEFQEPEIFTYGFEYREHTFILPDDGHGEPKIIDGDGDTLALLGAGETARGAALWLDGWLDGQEAGRCSGNAQGRREREKEIAGVVRVLIGAAFKDVLEPVSRELANIAEAL